LLEGTAISIGRGTDIPFQFVGHPKFAKGNIELTPLSCAGAHNPKWKDETCKGYNINELGIETILNTKQISLELVLDAYENAPKDHFFKNSFNKLAGNDMLQSQIKSRTAEEAIRLSWQNDLQAYKLMRKQYLLYPDFE
jgi:uncharacterized protein YbbC (DUF1343 family)